MSAQPRGRCYRVTVAGPLPRSAVAVIRDRFGGVSIRSRPGVVPAATVLDVRCTDQPALRALLTLLWDVGHDVLSLTPITEEYLP